MSAEMQLTEESWSILEFFDQTLEEVEKDEAARMEVKAGAGSRERLINLLFRGRQTSFLRPFLSTRVTTQSFNINTTHPSSRYTCLNFKFHSSLNQK
jgi:spore cortex formation protein SpoVR/YcgB (stage V sporulation)